MDYVFNDRSAPIKRDQENNADGKVVNSLSNPYGR